MHEVYAQKNSKKLLWGWTGWFEDKTMIRQLMRSRRRSVVVDIDTQKDLLFFEGSACTRNHRRVLANIRRVMAWARGRKISTISTCEIYQKGDNGDYCIEGTEGQEKVSYTLLNSRISFAADSLTTLSRDILHKYQQVILHKRCADPFGEPMIERLLSELRAGEFILIGSCAEEAVLATALGLLQRGKKVTLVVDAVGWHNKRGADMALRKMKTKGAKLIETKKLAGVSHLNQVRACGCKSCLAERNKAVVSSELR